MMVESDDGLEEFSRKFLLWGVYCCRMFFGLVFNLISMKHVKLFVSLTAVAAILAVSLAAGAWAAFSDVGSGHANYDAIMYVQENDIVGGYPDGTFRPDDPINRAELLKILIETKYGDEIGDFGLSSACLFSDVASSAWYAKYVCMGKTDDIVDGYPDGTFRPTEYVSFVEAAKMIVITMGYLAYPNEEVWYEPYVYALGDRNAIPTSIAGFSVDLTRGEMAEIIYRLDAEITDKAYLSYNDLYLMGMQSTGWIEPFITITSPADNAVLYEEPFYIKGTVSGTCSEIFVEALNNVYGIHDEYTLKNYSYGDTTFKYGVQHDWDNLELGENNYYFTAYCDDDKGNAKGYWVQDNVAIYYEDETAVEMGKPVIYLYPERPMEVYVMPKPEDGVTISEPELGDGWEVLAYPNGSLVNLEDGGRWEYLFWEGFSDLEAPDEGFVVVHDQLGRFFDWSLSYLGLNAKEIADFKEFWLVQLLEEGYYVISFVDQSELDEHAPLVVEPAPDTSIRVFFDYKVSDKPVRVKRQVLEKGPSRDGFTLVEWGGALY